MKTSTYQKMAQRNYARVEEMLKKRKLEGINMNKDADPELTRKRRIVEEHQERRLRKEWEDY